MVLALFITFSMSKTNSDAYVCAVVFLHMLQQIVVPYAWIYFFK